MRDPLSFCLALLHFCILWNCPRRCHYLLQKEIGQPEAQGGRMSVSGQSRKNNLAAVETGSSSLSVGQLAVKGWRLFLRPVWPSWNRGAVGSVIAERVWYQTLAQSGRLNNWLAVMQVGDTDTLIWLRRKRTASVFHFSLLLPFFRGRSRGG